METDKKRVARFLDQLRLFRRHANAVWSAYQDKGPGNVDSALFENVDSAAAALNSKLADTRIVKLLDVCGHDSGQTIASLRQAVELVLDLTERCARRSEGLCFVTGEAGLIPRRDLHASLESSLQIVRDFCQALEDNTVE